MSKEIYAFPKRFIATTIIKHKPDYKSENKQYEIIMSFLDLWLPRACAFLPFGIAPTYQYRICDRKPYTITVNSDVAPTYLCRLPHVMRELISRMVTHQRDSVSAPKPKKQSDCSKIPTPICWCPIEPEACAIHAYYDSDCAYVPNYTIKQPQRYLAENGHLVPYDTPQTFAGIEFKYKLHHMRGSAFDPMYDGKTYADNECKKCSHYISFRTDAYFEYGRPHKIGRPALCGEYYLFGERIDPGYDTKCTHNADKHITNATTIEFRGKTYQGSRIDFPNGWARKLSMSFHKNHIRIDKAAIVDGKIKYKLNLSESYRGDWEEYYLKVVVTLTDTPTFTIKHRHGGQGFTRADIIDIFYRCFDTRQVLAFLRPYED